MIFSEQFIQEYENNNSLGKLNDLVSQSLFNDDFQTAANLLQQVLTLDGNDPVSWMNLGHCLLQLGNYQECLTAYQYACLL